MKKNHRVIFAVTLLGFMLFSAVVACVSSAQAENLEETMLVPIQSIMVGPSVKIMVAYDVDTGVMWLFSRNGGIYPMLNADGTLKVYEGLANEDRPN